MSPPSPPHHKCNEAHDRDRDEECPSNEDVNQPVLEDNPHAGRHDGSSCKGATPILCKPMGVLTMWTPDDEPENANKGTEHTERRDELR